MTSWQSHGASPSLKPTILYTVLLYDVDRPEETHVHHLFCVASVTGNGGRHQVFLSSTMVKVCSERPALLMLRGYETAAVEEIGGEHRRHP